MNKDTITINKELIPYNFYILLGDINYKLEVNYNNSANLFTIALFKDDKLICIEPIIYGIPLFKDVFQPNIYPALDIVPIDESGKMTTVTFDNLSNTVLLTIDNGGDET